MRLVEVGVVKCEVEEPELRELLPLISRILREGAVRETIPVSRRGESLIVTGNYGLYYALTTLGVKYLPVSEGVEEVQVRLEDLGFYDEVRGDPVRVYENTLELLVKGWPTPLVRLASLSSEDVNVWAKLECYNPFSNSVKDRIGWYMFVDAARRGELQDVIYEATSTNTGIALASMAAIHGKKARLYVPSSIQKVTDTYLRILGAEVVRTPTSLTVEAIEGVDRDAARDGATHLNQFENDANFKVHLRFTAKELDLQLRERGITPSCIIGGIGTSGHMSALSFYFKNRYGNVRVVGVQPAPGEVIPGIRRVETGMKWIHMVEFDEIVDVTLEEAVRSSISIARREGLLVGLSSGAVVKAFLKLGDKTGNVILVFPDSGYKYFELFEKYL